MQMPPGSAMLSSRAATLTPSPRMSLPSIRMSPRLIPILNNIRRSEGTPSLRSAIAACTAFDCIDHREKLQQHPVSVGLDDATAMLGQQRIGDGAVFAERASGTDLINAHQAGIAGDV